MNKIKAVLSYVSATAVIVSFEVFATITKLPTAPGDKNTIQDVTWGIYGFLSYGVAGIATLFIAFGALQMWVDDKDAGLQKVKWSVVVMLIFFLAPTIINLIIDLLK